MQIIVLKSTSICSEILQNSWTCCVYRHF